MPSCGNPFPPHNGITNQHDRHATGTPGNLSIYYLIPVPSTMISEAVWLLML